MIFNIDKWHDKAKKIKLHGHELYVVKPDDFVPIDPEKLGWVHFSEDAPIKEPSVYFPDDSRKCFEIKPLNKKRFIFTYKAGWAKTDSGYIIVAKTRKWLILLLGVLGVTSTMLAIGLTNHVAPKDVLDYVTNQGAKSNSKSQSVLEYSSYGAPDETVYWKVNQRVQNIRLSLPKNVYIKEADGSTYQKENNVDAAAHIYVDLNRDGKYSQKECVYNPIKYGKNGQITDLKHFLKPGWQINRVIVNRNIPKGSYKAKVTWTGITKDGEMANPASFIFNLKVR